MATNYHSNEQRTNYSRLCRAIIDLSADVLREFLKGQVSPSNIWTKVNKNKEKLNKVTNQDQRKIILNAASIGSYEKFDATLLILVLRLLSVQDVCSILETSIPYQALQTTLLTCPALSSDPQTKLSQQELKDLQHIINKKSYINGKDELLWKLYTHLCAPTHKNLVHPTVKWGKAEMPDPAHTTVGDDIERLRHLRNKAYGHVSSTEITKQEFNTSWKELDGIMVRMDKKLSGHNFKASLDEIKITCMDPAIEQKFLEKIKKMADDDKSIHDELKENVTKLKIDVSETKNDVSEVKNEVSEIKDNVSETENSVFEMKNHVSEMKDNISELRDDVSEIKEKQVKGGMISEERRLYEGVIISEERRLYEDHTRTQIDRHKADKTFVLTPAVSRGIDILTEHRVLIYSGRPGQGKTKNALETMKQIREKHPDWTFIKLDDVKKWKSLINPFIPSVILLNDVIGKTNLDAGLINDGDKHFPNILANVEHGKVKVIMTIRNILLDKNRVKLEKYELFDSRYTIDLTAGQLKLNEETKKNILLKHCKNNKIEICKFNGNFKSVDINDEKSVIRIDEWTIDEIVRTDPLFGFPLACYLFCCKRKYTRLGIKFFAKPNQYLIEEISSLIKSEATRLEQIQYCVMVYMLMKNGKLGKDLDIKIFDKITKSIELSKPPTKLERKEAIEKLLNKYIVRGVDSQYEFKHQTILESVAVCFTEIDPCLLLEVCSQDFIREFVKPKNFKETEGEVVCKVDRKAYNTIVNRCVYSIENGRRDVYKYGWWINHPLLQNEEFVTCLVDNIHSKSKCNNKLCLAQVFKDVCFFSENTLILEKLYTSLKHTKFKQNSFIFVVNDNVLKWLVDHNLVQNYSICSAFHLEVSYVNYPCLTLTDVIKNLKRIKCNSGVIKAIFNRWTCIERCHVLDLLGNFIRKGRPLDCIKAIVDCCPDIATDVNLKEMFSLACIGDNNNLEIIEYLLSLDKGNKKTIHIKNADDDKLTNLHLAAYYGKVDVCKKLIKLGLRLDVRTVSGLSVLQAAILPLCYRFGDIKLILSHSETLADFVKNKDLFFSCLNRNYEKLFEFILTDNSSIIDKNDLNMAVDDKDTKLVHICVGKRKLSIIELLHKISPSFVHATNKDNMSGLHIAALLGNFNIFLKFVEFGVFDTYKTSKSRLSILKLVMIGMIGVIPHFVLRALNLSSILLSPAIDDYNRWRKMVFDLKDIAIDSNQINNSIMKPVFTWLYQHQIIREKQNRFFSNQASNYILMIIFLMQYDIKHFEKDLGLVVDEFGSAIVISCVFHDSLSLLDMFYIIDKRLFHITNENNISANDFAALLGKSEIFMKLVEFGSSVSEKSYISGHNTLELAMIGYTKHGLSVEPNNSSIFCNERDLYKIESLRFAKLQSYEDLITYLLQHTQLSLSDLGMAVNDFKNSIIHYFVVFNSMSLIPLLHSKHPVLLSGVSATKSKKRPDIRDRQMTPIQLSVIMGRSVILKFLLSCTDVVDIDIINLIHLVSEGKKYVGYDLKKYKTPDFLDFVSSHLDSYICHGIKFGSEDDYQSISETLESKKERTEINTPVSELKSLKQEFVGNCHPLTKAQ